MGIYPRPRGVALPDGRARLYYDMAVDRLDEAAGRDEVLDRSARMWVLKDAETCLWAARAEYLSWMVE